MLSGISTGKKKTEWIAWDEVGYLLPIASLADQVRFSVHKHRSTLLQWYCVCDGGSSYSKKKSQFIASLLAISSPCICQSDVWGLVLKKHNAVLQNQRLHLKTE